MLHLIVTLFVLVWLLLEFIPPDVRVENAFSPYMFLERTFW